MSLDDVLRDAVREVVAEELRRALKPPQAMTAEQLADYLQLGVSVIYREARAGRVPFHRFGRALRFERGAIDALMGKVGAPPASIPPE
ncbi:MAG TPA: helix-turn-helix domain-containing protein [Nocardioidaceae bacterium]|nr:helix-turn-helix domain-containing protein [Nocardioidaceae bacterium]